MRVLDFVLIWTVCCQDIDDRAGLTGPKAVIPDAATFLCYDCVGTPLDCSASMIGVECIGREQVNERRVYTQHLLMHTYYTNRPAVLLLRSSILGHSSN